MVVTARIFPSLIVVFLLLLAAPLLAQKEFFVESQTLTAGSQQQDILVEARSDIPLYGYSFGLLFDPTILSVTEVTWEGALATEPAFFQGLFDNSTGGIGYGCVLDYGPGFENVIPAGQDIALARIVVDVAPGIDTITVLAFGEPLIAPGRPVKNVITTGQGFSEFPDLTQGTLTIAPGETGDETFIRGDSNSDGRVDLSDAVSVLDFLFAGREPSRCFDAMDGNDDGHVDLSDPIFLLGFFFGGGPRIPTPYPERGVDPTEDALPVCKTE